MDDFSFDRPEITGTLITMEFGQGGRIMQLWASDPALPEQNEEFQFVISPVSLGDEFAEDYFPGTILLGVRIDPDDPWIVSRNSDAEPLEEGEDPMKMGFKYDFALLPEIEATGRFFEIPGPVPQICWEVEIRNGGKKSIEIGELAFPFALNNIYEGFPHSEDGMAEMLKDRLYVHQFVGGAGSYLFAQRMNAQPPGLLIFPGEGTRWEFINHVPASLNTPFRWEGIPVAYVHSRATVEREGWSNWFNDHSSLFLEPGDSKIFQTRFAPATRDQFDSVNPTLASCGMPAIKLLPGAVAPAEVGIAVEVAGATPTQFYTNVPAEIETDSDEEGGFCFVRPREPGFLRVGFTDTKGRDSWVHTLFIEPIENLIRARAHWISTKQVVDQPASNLHHAILSADISLEAPLTDPEDYATPFGILSSLADALYLAEKNTIYPDREEIAVLEAYCQDFLLDDVQNPGDGSVGVVLSDAKSISSNTGHAPAYPLVVSFYETMARLSGLMGGMARSRAEYLRLAAQTALAMFQHVPTSDYHGVGVPFMPEVVALVGSLASVPELEGLRNALEARLSEPVQAGGSGAGAAFGRNYWNLDGFEQAYFGPWIGLNRADREELLSYAFAARSLSPSWWWYGSDKRMLDELDGPNPAMADKGEMCLGPTSVAHSAMLLDTLDRDQAFLPESWLRMAFGGMLGPWALVRPDGAASMGFCPDPSSRQYGVSALTGDIGLSLTRYLRRATSYVLPTRVSGVVTFGCHFETENGADGEEFVVRPWDGVGRRIVVRQLGIEASTSFGRMLELRFDARKRRAVVLLHNPAAQVMESVLTIRGLWGVQVTVGNATYEANPGEGGAIRIPLSLEAHAEKNVEVKVTG